MAGLLEWSRDVCTHLFQNEEGATALMLACQREELENVGLLLDQGVR